MARPKLSPWNQYSGTCHKRYFELNLSGYDLMCRLEQVPLLLCCGSLPRTIQLIIRDSSTCDFTIHRHWKVTVPRASLSSCISIGFGMGICVDLPYIYKIRHNGFIFGTTIHQRASHMHIKYLVILTCSLLSGSHFGTFLWFAIPPMQTVIETVIFFSEIYEHFL